MPSKEIYNNWKKVSVENEPTECFTRIINSDTYKFKNPNLKSIEYTVEKHSDYDCARFHKLIPLWIIKTYNRFTAQGNMHIRDKQETSFIEFFDDVDSVIQYANNLINEEIIDKRSNIFVERMG